MNNFELDLPTKDEKQAFQDYIDDIKMQIRVPYIKSRIEERRVKDNQQEEMSDLVQEIGNKEEQLQGLCELGQFLLEKHDQVEIDFVEQVKHLQNQIVDQETDIEFQKQSNNQYRKMYNESLEKIDSLQQEVLCAKDQCDELKHQNKVYEGQINQLQNIQNEQQLNDNKQEQIKAKLLNEEINQLNKDLQEQKSIVKSIRQQLIECENNNRKYTEIIERQNQEAKEEQFKQQKLQMQLKEKDNIIDDLETHQSEQKEQIHDLNTRIFDYRSNVDKLEAEKAQLANSLQNSNINKKSQVLYTEQPEILQTQESQQDQFAQNVYGNLLSEIEDLGVIQDDNKTSFGRENGLYINENREQSNSNNDEMFKSQDISNNLLQPQYNAFQKNKQKVPTIVVSEEQNLNSSIHMEDSQAKEMQQQDKQQEKQNNKNQLIQDIIRQKKNTEANLNQSNNHSQSQENNKQIEMQTQSANKKKQATAGRRRDPYEEFFSLTCQCVKLNSMYMDDIIDMDTSGYYIQVRQSCIPYHMWYDYVKEKLLEQREILMSI